MTFPHRWVIFPDVRTIDAEIDQRQLPFVQRAFDFGKVCVIEASQHPVPDVGGAQVVAVATTLQIAKEIDLAGAQQAVKGVRGNGDVHSFSSFHVLMLT